jgi:pimeloyl-ACP methyl ester carboxylesterase
MGGFFAMAFATAHPERVRRLVLLSASVGLFREFPLFLRLMGNSITGPLIARLKIRDVEMLRKRVFSPYLVHPDRIPLDVLEVALTGMALPGTATTNQAVMHAVTTLRGLRPELWMADSMARLGLPTQFVWGDHDRVGASTIAENLSRRMSGGQLTVIPDAGHLPQLDQPEAVAEAVNPFLRASDPT